MKTIPVRQITAAQKEQSKVGRFSIRKIEEILGGNDLRHDLHRHNFYFILLLHSGEGVHEIDFVPHPVTNKFIFLLRPGQVHQLRLKAGATGYLMEFDTAFYYPTGQPAAQRLRKASSKNVCQLEAGRFGKLSTIISNIFDEYVRKEHGYPDAIKAGLDLFYIEFARQSLDPKRTDTTGGFYIQDRFDEFVNLLETHFSTHKLVSQYTGLMRLSSYQLNDITKTTVGKTASALIDEYILLEAKRYLLATPNQVKEIAVHLGYEDVSYFIRFFKKHTGQSPEAFRKNFT